MRESLLILYSYTMHNAKRHASHLNMVNMQGHDSIFIFSLQR